MVLFIIKLTLVFGRRVGSTLISDCQPAIAQRTIIGGRGGGTDCSFSDIRSLDLRDITTTQTGGRSVGMVNRVTVPSVSVMLPVTGKISGAALTLTTNAVHRSVRVKGNGCTLTKRGVTGNDGVLFSPLCCRTGGNRVVCLASVGQICRCQVCRHGFVGTASIRIIGSAGGTVIALVAYSSANGKHLVVEKGLIHDRGFSRTPRGTRGTLDDGCAAKHSRRWGKVEHNCLHLVSFYL